MSWTKIQGGELQRLQTRLEMPPQCTILEASLRTPFYHNGELVKMNDGMGTMFMVAAGPSELDRSPRPERVWNRIPNDVRCQVVQLALDEPELSPRELATRFTDTKNYFVSEASVYRLLKEHDLIASPAYIVVKAADEFKDKTTAPNQLWQTDFTYLKVIGWAEPAKVRRCEASLDGRRRAGSISARSWMTSRVTSSPGSSARQ
jgi:hypothetical protein